MMAHYAFLDENNTVTQVITGVDENIIQTDLDGTQVGGSTEAWETFYGNLHNQPCKRTSYNTRGGIHTGDGVPFRKNYAGIGFFYDSIKDAFIPPEPYSSWTLNETTCLWESPTPYPEGEFDYTWNEDTLSWDLLTPSPDKVS